MHVYLEYHALFAPKANIVSQHKYNSCLASSHRLSDFTKAFYSVDQTGQAGQGYTFLT